MLAAALFLPALGAQVASAQTSLPTYINTPSGSMHAEDRYLPGVVQAELGWIAGPRGATECLKAQSIAARTFVLRWLNGNGRTRTIPALGPTFQAWTSGASAASRAASQAVRGQIMTYQGEVIFSNYAAGAWPIDGNGFPFAPSRYGYASSMTWSSLRTLYTQQHGTASWRSQVTSRNSWAWTYILNTDNEGKSGAAVTQTIHASRGSRNRGGLGQYRAMWLDSERGYGYARILRAFYGEDVTIVGAGSSATTTPARTTPSVQPTLTTTATGAADLEVRALTVSNPSGDATTVGVGHDLTFRARIENAGGAMTGALPVRVAYTANGAAIGSGVAVIQLGAGQSAEIGLDTGAFRPSAPGAYTIEAVANSDGRVGESNRSNNGRTVALRAYQPLRVTGSVLNVRASASEGASVLGTLRAGDVVAARARSGDWFQVDFVAGVQGWIHGGYVASAGRVTAVRITADALNVRNGPATMAARIGGASAGQVFVSQGGQSGWQQIFWGGGSGWVSATSADLAVTLGL